jgi:hypothetical protein
MTEDPQFARPADDRAQEGAVDDAGDDAGDGAVDGAEVPAAPQEPERVRTGVGRVDEVIAAVEELEERPVEEHVGVFEAAQDRLRRALDATDAGDDPA